MASRDWYWNQLGWWSVAVLICSAPCLVYAATSPSFNPVMGGAMFGGMLLVIVIASGVTSLPWWRFRGHLPTGRALRAALMLRMALSVISLLVGSCILFWPNFPYPVLIKIVGVFALPDAWLSALPLLLLDRHFRTECELGRLSPLLSCVITILTGLLNLGFVMLLTTVLRLGMVIKQRMDWAGKRRDGVARPGGRA